MFNVGRTYFFVPESLADVTQPLESIQRKGGSIAAYSCAPLRGKRE
jgi:hypothetical protein